MRLLGLLAGLSGELTTLFTRCLAQHELQHKAPGRLSPRMIHVALGAACCTNLVWKCCLSPLSKCFNSKAKRATAKGCPGHFQSCLARWPPLATPWDGTVVTVCTFHPLRPRFCGLQRKQAGPRGSDFASCPGPASTLSLLMKVSYPGSDDQQ